MHFRYLVYVNSTQVGIAIRPLLWQKPGCRLDKPFVHSTVFQRYLQIWASRNEFITSNAFAGCFFETTKTHDHRPSNGMLSSCARWTKLSEFDNVIAFIVVRRSHKSFMALSQTCRALLSCSSLSTKDIYLFKPGGVLDVYYVYVAPTSTFCNRYRRPQ